MARSIGDELPAAAVSLLDGSDLRARAGLTFLLITSGSRDWPHLAMLSVGEIVAVDSHALRLGLWATSTTSGNLARSGRGLLVFVLDGRGYHVRFTAAREADLLLGADGSLAQFRLDVREVIEDVAEYAELTSGVTFRLRQPSSVMPRWERTVAALRRGGAST